MCNQRIKYKNIYLFFEKILILKSLKFPETLDMKTFIQFI